MTFKTILAAVSGGSASRGALDLSCRLARRFNAHLEGFHVVPDAPAALAMFGDIGVPSGSLIEAVMEEAQDKAAVTRDMFDGIIARHEISCASAPQLAAETPSACWREEAGYGPQLVARRARFFDLAVLGRSDRVIREPHTDTIEETIAHSGRPVLLAPAEAEAPPCVGKALTVAWNGSPQAVRALAMALPFLSEAEAVCLITIGVADTGDSLFALEYLAWHGIEAQHRCLPSRAGRHVGRTLLEAAQECGSDLLVMGAYGHAPWRELIFGGATRDALGTTTMPLLLVH